MPSAPRAAPTEAAAQQVYDSFHQIMGQAMDDSEIASRLAFADTVVHVHLRDSPQQFTMTLLFDRNPVEVVKGVSGSPEVELWIDTNDVFRFWNGEMHLAMGIAKGDIDYQGPVRKLLRVVPIARRLVGDYQRLVDAAARPDGSATHVMPSGPPAA